jgi:hypothetical protein
MKRVILILALLVASQFAWAGSKTNIVTASGVVYSNALVTSVEPDGLTVMVPTGIMKLAFTNLSAEIQSAYGYDPEKATAYKVDQARVAAARLQAQKVRQAHEQQLAQIEVEDFYGKVSSINKDYALAWRVVMVTHPNYDGSFGGGADPGLADEPVMIFGLPKNLVDGAMWDGKIYSAGITKYKAVGGGVKTVARYATSRDLAAQLLLHDK